MPVTSHEIYPAVAFGADGVEHIRGTSRRGYSPKVTARNRTRRPTSTRANGSSRRSRRRPSTS
jgi:hypothetical protein